MATAFPLPTAATPVERILSRFDRKQLEDFIEVAISLLDVANDDPDLEDSDPCYFKVDAKGNPLPGSEDFRTEDDEDCDFDDDPRMDMEEDDPSGQCDEDGVNTSPFAAYCAHGRSYDGPGCPISDPGEWPAPLTLNPDADSSLK